ncbi:MAG: hypothetical protein PHV85_00450 [Desulfovibrionaceae bacterium]|nr:hypothetical protein [Desulfovibrionaceae bacterium]
MSALHDWEMIEREYRAGQFSIRQIAEMPGAPSEAAIRKHAKRHGWSRDLTEQVRVRVAAELTSGDDSPEPKYTVSEREAVDAAAMRAVAVVRRHRAKLAKLSGIAEVLADKLVGLINGAEAGFLVQVKGKPGKQVRLGFLGSNESVCDALSKIARALARVIPLERQAYNLDPRGYEDVSAREQKVHFVMNLGSKKEPGK